MCIYGGFVHKLPIFVQESYLMCNQKLEIIRGPCPLCISLVSDFVSDGGWNGSRRGRGSPRPVERVGKPPFLTLYGIPWYPEKSSWYPGRQPKIYKKP